MGISLRNVVAVGACALPLLAGCSTQGQAQPAVGTGAASSGSLSITPSLTPTATATATAESEATAAELARKITGPQVVKVVDLTEDNDSNNLLGRPNGFKSASVVYDSRLTCQKPEVACGLSVEVWPTSADAAKRAAYIQGILKDAPFLGTEYHALRGTALLRGSGKLKPSAWKQYAASFTG